MDIEILKELIGKCYNQRKIAEELNCSQSTIKYWLKRYSLKTVNTKKYEHIKVTKNEKYCPRCEKIKLKKDFFKKNKTGDVLQSYCKKCNIKNVVERGRAKKLEMLEYKGNKCVDCELKVKDSHPCVFDFHHLDPNEKDVNLFKTIKTKKWEEIKKELDKCVILCSNCHRIRHFEIIL